MLSFLLGVYMAIAIVVGIGYAFLTILGGKSTTRIEFYLDIVLSAILWPITLYRVFSGKV